MGWNYLSISKLQRCNRWSLEMDKLFHHTFYWTCDYLSMLGLKLNHVSKRGPGGIGGLEADSNNYVNLKMDLCMARIVTCSIIVRYWGKGNDIPGNWIHDPHKHAPLKVVAKVISLIMGGMSQPCSGPSSQSRVNISSALRVYMCSPLFELR